MLERKKEGRKEGKRKRKRKKQKRFFDLSKENSIILAQISSIFYKFIVIFKVTLQARIILTSLKI